MFKLPLLATLLAPTPTLADSPAGAPMQVCFADGTNALYLGLEGQVPSPVLALSATGVLVTPRKTVPIYGAALQDSDYNWVFNLSNLPQMRFTQTLEPLNSRWVRVPCN